MPLPNKGKKKLGGGCLPWTPQKKSNNCKFGWLCCWCLVALEIFVCFPCIYLHFQVLLKLGFCAGPHGVAEIWGADRERWVPTACPPIADRSPRRNGGRFRVPAPADPGRAAWEILGGGTSPPTQWHSSTPIQPPGIPQYWAICAACLELSNSSKPSLNRSVFV